MKGVFYNYENLSNSGKIEPEYRQGAGVQGSWSWTECNFHPDDPLDESYTDPNFTPSYTISGFTDDQIDNGKFIDIRLQCYTFLTF